VAYVVAQESQTPDAAALRAHVRASLPDYMVPTAFVVLDRLPLTASGKLDRRALPAPDLTFALRRAPRTPKEVVLCGLFAQVLGVERVSIDDNFFALGGHSLLAIRLIGQIRATLNIKISIRSLFENSTVERLSRSIAAGYSQHSAFEDLLPIRPTGSSRPLFCIHPAIGLSWSYARLLQHIPSEHPVYGLQARNLRHPENAPTSMEQMAAEYLQLIRSVQRAGPYNLLGWSFGGLVAHAIATQLQSEGQGIALLALVDSYPSIGAHAPLNLDVPDNPARGNRDSATESKVRSILLDLQREGHAPFMLKEKDLDMIRAVISNNVRLAATFPRWRFHGEAVLFTAANGDAEPPIDGWRPFIAGRLEIHPIASVHERMMDAWPASVIGRVIASELGRRENNRPLPGEGQ
jgi:thioesterase domain-containing protein/acyl carrier protein